MPYKIHFVLAVTIGIASTAGAYFNMLKPAESVTVDESEELRRIEVWLAESVERVEGWTWGRRGNGEPLMMTAIQEPAHIVIHLPSGKTIESFTMGVTMDNDGGLVSEVVLQPLPELAKDYDEVVDAAESVLKRWALEDVFRSGIAKWRNMYDQDPISIPAEERKISYKKYINVEIEPGIWLSPERGIHFRGEGWYLQMNVYGGEAVRQKIGQQD